MLMFVTPAGLGRISAVGTTGPSDPSSPPTTRMDPLLSVIAVGYQRASE